MALAHSPRIVTNGLVLCLDAANLKSYSGTGTSWTDLSGNGNNGTLVNGVNYSSSNNGALVFDGTNDYISLASPSNRWAWTPSGSGNTTLSFEMWVNSTDSSGLYFSKPWNGSGEYNYTMSSSGWSQRIGNQSRNISFSSLATGNPEHVVCIITPTQSAVYRNGVINQNFTDHNITNVVPSSGNSNLPLAIMTLYPYGEGWAGITTHAIAGEVYNFKVYDKVLTATEVQQNFNALKGRYGI